MSSPVDVSKILVLSNQSNYQSWVMEVEASACLGGFWKAYLGTNKVTTGTADISKINWIEQHEQKAVGLILKTITPNLCIKISEAIKKATPASDSKAQYFWDYLKVKLKKADGISALLNFTSLVETKFLDNGTLEAQLNTLDTIRSRCALNSITFEDWQYATLLLVKLPESYKFISDFFLTMGQVKNLDPTTITMKIVDTEICARLSPPRWPMPHPETLGTVLDPRQRTKGSLLLTIDLATTARSLGTGYMIVVRRRKMTRRPKMDKPGVAC